LNTANNNKKEDKDFHRIAENEAAIDKKLNEIIELLSTKDINTDTAKEFQQRFDTAIKKSGIQSHQVEAFKNLDNSNASREELLDEFSILLSTNQFGSKISKKQDRGERLSKIVLVVISIVMITLGFGMIIMPAPPYFEMFTIFYFNENDGITIMDLISLLIILAGVYFLIKAVVRNPILKK
jgi:hypothetical protein